NGRGQYPRADHPPPRHRLLPLPHFNRFVTTLWYSQHGMSNQALPQPRFNAPGPERGSKAALKIEARTTPLLDGKVSEIPDVFFGWAMRLCGVAVVALLGLIVYQLVVGSELSWHAFGWKFFGQSDSHPVEDQYGALPFMF